MTFYSILIFSWISLNGLFIIHGIPLENTTSIVSENIMIKTNSTSEDFLSSDDKKFAVEPPLIFPNDPRMYKILALDDVSPNNDTAIKILLTRAREESEQNVEEQDISLKVSTTLATSVGRSIKPAHMDSLESLPNEVDENLKSEVEAIQPSDISKPEVGLEELFQQPNSDRQVNEIFAEDIEMHNVRLNQGHITAIFAGVLAILCISIYVGLITWRSYLENRYGMRERLVTQDDYYNNNDIRQFDLHRHGARTPMMSYPNDPYKNYSWPGGWGALTKCGMKQLNRVGTTLETRYKTLIPNNKLYSKKFMHVRSSNYERCLQSVSSLLASFMWLPKNEQIFDNSDCNWQPIPIHTMPQDEDYELAQEKPCPNFVSTYVDALKINYSDPEINLITNSKPEQFFKYIADNSGEACIKKYLVLAELDCSR